MKAKELAELLLEHPESEIYTYIDIGIPPTRVFEFNIHDFYYDGERFLIKNS